MPQAGGQVDGHRDFRERWSLVPMRGGDVSRLLATFMTRSQPGVQGVFLRSAGAFGAGGRGLQRKIALPSSLSAASGLIEGDPT